jgi:hypothetical protein
MNLSQDLLDIFREQVKASKYLSLQGLINMARIESNNDPCAVSPTGAVGLFQFTLPTWNDFLPGKNRLDPELNTIACIKLANRNGNYMVDELDITPEDYQIYIAHNIGAGGAVRLLRAEPSEIVTRSLIGSSPENNPRFLMRNGHYITVIEALTNYRREFQV